MIDIKAIKAAAEAANQTKWQAYHDHGWLVVGSDDETVYVKVSKGSSAASPDATHIATANPATVIALCDEIERLTIIASELQDLCDRQAKRLAEVEKDAARLDHVLKWDDGYWTSRLQIDKCIADDADMENMK